MEESQKRRISLVTTMGIPASGKTSLCQELLKFVSGKDSESRLFHLIQYDVIVPLRVQSQFSHHPNLAKTLRMNFLSILTHLIQVLQEGKSLTELTQLAETELSSEAEEILPKMDFISAFVSQLSTIPDNTTSSSAVSDLILLIDDNNYYKSMRNEFFQIAKSNGLGFCVLYPTAPLKVCYERNLERDEAARIPSKVIEDMSGKLEEPNPLQNPADILCLQVSDVLDPSTHQMIYDTLLYTLQNPIRPNLAKASSEEIAKERRICAENEIHQADLILRKWIHKELTLASFGTKGEALRKKSQEYQQKKQKVLEGLRSTEIQVTSSPGDEYEYHKEILGLARSVKLE